jgi:hypothetical protein
VEKGNMKKIVSAALLGILLLSMIFVLAVPTWAVTEDEIKEAIDSGVAWLAAQQKLDGSWGTGGATVAKTGLAVVKLCEHAVDSKYGYGLASPFDPAYPYHENVEKGLDYIFANAHIIIIGMQTHGNPDTDGDGIGVCFEDVDYWGRPVPIYTTGIALMAIATSRAPDRVVDVPGSPVNGWKYKDVVQDAVDYMAWAQTDWGYGRGGWNYEAMDNSGERSDQSNTGWATFGLGFAESAEYGFVCTVPDFVKKELNIWIDYIQNDVDGDTNDGGAGYTDPNCWVNILKTGHLIYMMAFVGDTAATPRVKDAVAYIVRHWNDANDDPGWRGWPGGVASYHATFNVMKGLTALGIQKIDEIDWQSEFEDVLVAQQNPDGSWPVCVWSDGERILSTEWALLTLQKVVPRKLTPGKVTGGGQIAISSKASFGFNVMYQEGWDVPKGELQYVDYATKMIVHSHNMTSLVVSPDKTKATFEGICTINGVDGFTYRVYVEDNGEPGKNDVFKITLSTGYSAGGTILNGNIQIHKKP